MTRDIQDEENREVTKTKHDVAAVGHGAASTPAHSAQSSSGLSSSPPATSPLNQYFLFPKNILLWKEIVCLFGAKM